MADYVLKICLLGEGGVGKTSLVYRFIENRFTRDFKSTLGVNLLKKTVDLGEKIVSAQIWDLGGQSAYMKLRKLYLEGSQGALVIFDITNQASFDKLGEWISTLQEIRGNDVPMVIIGNKTDLKANQVVSKEQAEIYAKNLNVPILFTSAATGEQVEDAFKELIKKIVKDLEEKQKKLKK